MAFLVSFGLRREVLQHVHGLKVHGQRHFGDLVLKDEVNGQEDDGDEDVEAYSGSVP